MGLRGSHGPAVGLSVRVREIDGDETRQQQKRRQVLRRVQQVQSTAPTDSRGEVRTWTWPMVHVLLLLDCIRAAESE